MTSIKNLDLSKIIYIIFWRWLEKVLYHVSSCPTPFIPRATAGAWNTNNTFNTTQTQSFLAAKREQWLMVILVIIAKTYWTIHIIIIQKRIYSIIIFRNLNVYILWTIVDVEVPKQLRSYTKLSVSNLYRFLKLNMHGPEAVGIIRNDLSFSGPIIGIAVSIATSIYVFQRSYHRYRSLYRDIKICIWLSAICCRRHWECVAHWYSGSVGTNEVLTKPVTKAKLIETLRNYHHFDQ